MHVAAMSRMRQHAALLQAEGGTEQRGVHLVAVVCREQHAPLLQERIFYFDSRQIWKAGRLSH